MGSEDARHHVSDWILRRDGLESGMLLSLETVTVGNLDVESERYA